MLVNLMECAVLGIVMAQHHTVLLDLDRNSFRKPGITEINGLLIEQLNAKQMFSGKFRVFSRYPNTIRISKWENFGMAGPARGTIVPDAEKLTNFPKLETIPESTAVEWKDVKTGETKTQTLSLKGVVPPDVEGRTQFELGADGKWSVKFEAEK